MHTAHQFKSSMFSVTLGQAAGTREDLLQWQSQDRLGILVKDPFGALGAGLITLLVCTAFYDADRARRRRPLYPPIFLFHVGQGWGFHGELDFWPDRKEIFVAADAAEILRSINQIGITHLALPPSTVSETLHSYKEPEEALDRLKQCFLYGPGGQLSEADVQIMTETPAVIENLRRIVLAEETLAAGERAVAEMPRLQTVSPLAISTRHYYTLLRQRLNEVSPNNHAAVEWRSRLEQALKQRRLVESLRRVTPQAAIDLL